MISFPSKTNILSKKFPHQPIMMDDSDSPFVTDGLNSIANGMFMSTSLWVLAMMVILLLRIVNSHIAFLSVRYHGIPPRTKFLL